MWPDYVREVMKVFDAVIFNMSRIFVPRISMLTCNDFLSCSFTLDLKVTSQIVSCDTPSSTDSEASCGNSFSAKGV